MKLDEKETKHPNFWIKSLELSGNYNFNYLDPNAQINLPKLWGYQTMSPQISITWPVIEAAMPLLWVK